MHLKQLTSGSAYILDNGAYMAKMGHSFLNSPKLMPNCIMKVKSERRRPFISDQIEECGDASGLFYILPFQKGYLVNWDIQKTVWDYIFSKELNNGKLSEVPICITEPVMNFQSVQEAMDEIFFEEYECCALLRLTSTDLAAYNYCSTRKEVDTCVVIDTGYSFTHIVPYIDGKKYLRGAKRIDIGGKVLTNHLKEIISYRQLHVMDETYVINQMKEDSCFVSKDFIQDMKTTQYKDQRNTILRDYVLPDYNKIRRGYLFNPYQPKVEPTAGTSSKDDANNPLNGETQAIRLNNERITIPEILFHPTDIGIQQKGIAEAIIESISDCPPEAKYQLLNNIIVIGGNANFPNFQNRMYADVKKYFDENFEVNVLVPPKPDVYPWEGGKHLAKANLLHQLLVSREEYEEYGSTIGSINMNNFNITM